MKIEKIRWTSQESLSIELPKNSTGHLTIYDMSGRPVLSQSLHQSNRIATSLCKGIYLYHINYSGDIFASGKMVVQ